MVINKETQAIEDLKHLSEVGEIFAYQNESIEMAIKALEKEIEQQVLKRKCDTCNIDCPDNCQERTDRCPNCTESISNDLDWEFKNCPHCGQKLKY